MEQKLYRDSEAFCAWCGAGIDPTTDDWGRKIDAIAYCTTNCKLDHAALRRAVEMQELEQDN